MEVPEDHTAFLGLNGSGYAQSMFAAGCTSCGKTIKKNMLGLYKFANDIVKIPGFLSYARLQPTAVQLYIDLLYVSAVEPCIPRMSNVIPDVLR